MRDIIITIPATIEWSEYEKELAEAKRGSIMNFKVSSFPKETGVGAKCWVVHKGFLKGFMKITGLSTEAFQCTVTGKNWNGKFIQRSGDFTYINEKIPCKGFQGFRYFAL